MKDSSDLGGCYPKTLLAVLCYKRLFTKACMGCKRFFLKKKKCYVFEKIGVPYCLVVFRFVVCPRLRPFWSVFGELALFWCSTAKRKAEQWFTECPSLEANNSSGKLPLASISPEIQSRYVAVPCPFTRFAIPLKLRRFGNVVEFPLQYLVVIIKSITYLSFRFLWNILHVLNNFGSVYGDDDVSRI